MVHGHKPQMARFEKNWAGTQNGLLAPAWRRNPDSYEPSGRHPVPPCIQATLTNTSCPTSCRVADVLYGLWAGRCEGGRHVKVPGRRNQREEAASQGRRSPTDGFLTDRRGQVCQSPSSQWRGHFPRPLWFLSITYQPGQSVAEIKQLLRTEGLWTQQGENSPTSLISLNLKRYINPWKAKITIWMTHRSGGLTVILTLSTSGHQCFLSHEMRGKHVELFLCSWKDIF